MKVCLSEMGGISQIHVLIYDIYETGYVSREFDGWAKDEIQTG